MSWTEKSSVLSKHASNVSSLIVIKIGRSLMGNVIETVRSMGSDYWAAYVGGEKIETDTLEPMSLLINDLP